MKILFCLLLLCSNQIPILTAQDTPKQYLHLMHYASHQYIPDAMVLIDNQVAVYDTIMHGYLIPHGLAPHQKRSLSLRHQKYQNQTIPAAVIQQLTLYMVLPNEPYYISNGIHFPIIQEERKDEIHIRGFDYIMVELHQYRYQELTAANAAMDSIVEQHNLIIAYSYQKDISKYPNEKSWGCLNRALNRTYYLKKRNNKKWKATDGKLLQKIRARAGVVQAGIPLNRTTTISAYFEIEYHRDIDTTTIKALEKKYKLTRIPNRTNYKQTYYYQSKKLLPSNILMQKLLQEKAVLFAQPSIMQYVECC